MKVFDDQITLWNGGSLPPGYTAEKLMEPHESHPRNRLTNTRGRFFFV